jgi:hypothetical protein
MPDYSFWRRCQWIVEQPQRSLWEETEHIEPRLHICRNRGRVQLGSWTWLCRQHSTMAKGLGAYDILARICSVAGRPYGQL